ncbi:MAG TPA: RsbRD N-terminal domain-containing protein [Thermodesulfovibrionales bacterium]|nr:RsbRD N-terminal domain-containing protein [Thermodesulfovibrionales bacterium]
MLNMVLNGILTEKKMSILGRWLRVLAESHSPDASTCFKAPKNICSNPTVSALSKDLENIFDELLCGASKGKTSESLVSIVRFRAVQGLLPSQALAFFFSLKRIIREELRAEMNEQQLSDEILSLESKIDGLALAAFNIFMECRERIYEIQADEVKRLNYRFLQRASCQDLAHGRQSDPEKHNFPIQEER